MNVRLLTASVAALVAVGALAACGKSDTPAGGSGSSGAQAAGCTGQSGSDNPKSLTLALVPSGDTTQIVNSAKPLTDYLTKALGIPVKGVISKDYSAAVEAMGANQAQIGMLPSLQMEQVCDKYHAKIILQTVRNGKITYAGQFFTNKPDKYCADTPVPDAHGMLFCNGTASGTGPAGLDSISKVKGAKVVLLDKGSPAGYIFPALALKKHGIDPAKDIQPITVQNNNASVLAVYNGDAEVGASYWDARTVVAKDKPDVGRKVVVFALTDEIPNDGVAVTSNLSADLQNKISQAMQEYAKTPAGKQTLNDIYQITDLRPADPKSLAIVAEAAQQLGLG